MKADIDDHFSLNEQIVFEDQGVKGHVDRAFDGVLDGGEAKIRLARQLRLPRHRGLTGTRGDRRQQSRAG